MKFVVVTGGVLSGLGKGIVASSLGKLLQLRGYKVAPIKFDGYLNVDAGTMNPIRHGEVFVCSDGTECDMDLGNYERFLGVEMGRENNPTGGKFFELILEKERRGDYLGADVQFIPHVTQEARDWVKNAAKGADIAIIEVGGTVGDMENAYFIEAMRHLKQQEPEHNVIFVHLTLVPSLKVVGEQKTKPTQQSVRALLSAGVQPDFIVCRTDEPLNDHARKKIASFCNVPMEQVISDHDCNSIYEAPFVLEQEHFSSKVLTELVMPVNEIDLSLWRKLVSGITEPEKEVTIAIAGKYTTLHDSYVSILESLQHCGAHLKTRVNVKWIEASDDTDAEQELQGVDGLIVPGGFGTRGTEGKIKCIKFCRENNIPFLGLCYGMQMAVVEFARNVANMPKAHSTEIDFKTKYPVIDILPDQDEVLGGTMRLGAHQIFLDPKSKVKQIYRKDRISERFRHRYEVNPEYVDTLQKHGLVFSGWNSDKSIMQFLELPDKKFFVATQAHPEFQSSLEKPAPLFMAFVESCL